MRAPLAWTLLLATAATLTGCGGERLPTAEEVKNTPTVELPAQTPDNAKTTGKSIH